MGYRSEDQSISDPLRKILAGATEFDRAMQKRAESGEWQQEHLIELDALNRELWALRLKLIQLARDNW